jgi:hypothetical protein
MIFPIVMGFVVEDVNDMLGKWMAIRQYRWVCRTPNVNCASNSAIES